MFARGLILFLGLLLACPVSAADDRVVRFHAPPALHESGVVKFFVPRFSLKTQVKVEMVDDPATADLVFGDRGRALFEGLGQVWHMDVRSPGHLGTDKMAGWLTSDIGQRTIIGYAPDGVAPFAPPGVAAPVIADVTILGDAEAGHEISLSKCTRCHAVDDDTRMSGIGSTPSFGVLRSLQDWEGRFSAFYTLKPHAAFTQVIGVTAPFPADRPSPIAPIELTLDEIESVLAYVAAIPAADLGERLKHQ